MNLIEASNAAKDLSDSQLQRELLNPSGSLPSFLALSELQRRKEMRSDYAARAKAPPNRSMAEEMSGLGGMANSPYAQAVNGAEQGAPPGGPPQGGAMDQPMQTMGPPTQPPQGMGASAGFAAGGPVFGGAGPFGGTGASSWVNDAPSRAEQLRMLAADPSLSTYQIDTTGLKPPGTQGGILSGLIGHAGTPFNFGPQLQAQNWAQSQPGYTPGPLGGGPEPQGLPSGAPQPPVNMIIDQMVNGSANDGSAGSGQGGNAGAGSGDDGDGGTGGGTGGTYADGGPVSYDDLLYPSLSRRFSRDTPLAAAQRAIQADPSIKMMGQDNVVGQSPNIPMTPGMSLGETLAQRFQGRDASIPRNANSPGDTDVSYNPGVNAPGYGAFYGAATSQGLPSATDGPNGMGADPDGSPEPSNINRLATGLRGSIDDGGGAGGPGARGGTRGGGGGGGGGAGSGNGSIEDFYARIQGIKLPDRFGELAAKNEADRGKIKESIEGDKGMALLQAGLGIMAGESPFAAVNIGRGAMAGVKYWSDAQKEVRQAERDVRNADNAIAVAQANRDERGLENALKLKMHNEEILAKIHEANARAGASAADRAAAREERALDRAASREDLALNRSEMRAQREYESTIRLHASAASEIKGINSALLNPMINEEQKNELIQQRNESVSTMRNAEKRLRMMQGEKDAKVGREPEPTVAGSYIPGVGLKWGN